MSAPAAQSHDALRARTWALSIAALTLLATAPAAAGSSSSVDYGPISHNVVQGTNALFGGSCCPTRPGFDLATGWGSPAAGVIASSLVHAP